MLIHIDDSRGRRAGWQVSRSRGLGHLFLNWTSLRSRTPRGVQGFDEEAFGCLGIPPRAEQKLEGVPLTIDGPLEIQPDFLHFNGRLIHSPRIVAGFEVRPTAFVELRGITLHPTGDRAMIDVQTPLPH